MMGNDDPFFSSGSNDRTVIRPVPGGRVQDIPRNTGAFFAGDVQATPLERLGKLNPLENAASALLALAANLYNRPSHPSPQRLKQQLSAEIKHFHSSAAQASIDRETIQQASHALCTTIDEAIFNTPWGQQSGWTEQSLLSEFHGSVAGGEEFFLKLKAAGQNPGANLHLLELMYLCLAIGFQGRYRMAESGKSKLEQIQSWLVQRIRQQRGSSEKLLSPHWQGVKSPRVSFTRMLPLWVFYSLAGGVLLAVFLGLLSALAVYASPVKQHIDDIAFANGKIQTPSAIVVDRSLPNILQQSLAPEINAGLVSVYNKNGKPVIELRGDKGLFASGRDTLLDERREDLIKKVADSLSVPSFASYSFTIFGHTDNVPVRNPLSFQDNHALSRARADTVKILMKGQQPGLRLSVTGKGERDPIADNGTKEGRARNRRVEIVTD
jgi:type VI secretion system protein ImpK